MNETSKSPDSPFGVPFWIGYALSSVGWFVLVFGLHILENDAGFWLTLLQVFIAFGVGGPVGGLIFQAAHDLFLATWRGQLRFWDFVLLLAIVVACLALGRMNYLYGDGSPLWFPW